MPLTVSAKSSDIEPVEIAFMSTLLASPRRIIEPSPKRLRMSSSVTSRSSDFLGVDLVFGMFF